MKKRETRILEMLSEHGRVEVAKLAEALGVSQVTVRKDLDVLESRGILRREHGCAVFGGSDDINNRLALHYEEKRRIASLAAELVAPGETVMIESGSCCALLAEEIARTKPGATIITNSAFIASYIRGIEGARVVLLGGDFQNDAQVMVGPIMRTCAAQFYVDKLFIAANAISLDSLSTPSMEMASIKSTLINTADKVILLADSTKLSRKSFVRFANLEQVHTLITDKYADPEIVARILEKGVRVEQV